MTDQTHIREGAAEALAEVWYLWKMYTEAGTISEQADYFINLSNAMSDLFSWHPKWDYETGMMEGVIEDGN